MWRTIVLFARPRYASLSKTEDESPDQHRKTSSAFRIIRHCLTLFLAAVIGYILAILIYSPMELCQSNVRLSIKSETFTYNSTFGSAPSNETNAAWKELFPIQGGFFKHPKIAPHRSAFAVFHQLHCLDAIRQGYWFLYHSRTTDGQTSKYDPLPFMISPSHISHCIDLIRHALICMPDTTIEVRNETLKGVTGFGTEHQCKDFEQLLSWVEAWEGWQQEEARRVESTHT